MNLSITAAQPATTFVLDPSLPWLRTDRTMQSPKAFIGMETFSLGNYMPMGLHFPAKVQVVAKRVTHPTDLTEGVYYAERVLLEQGKVVVEVRYGRFAGLTPIKDERARARRLKQGKVHFELAVDVLPDDPRGDYLLREDGTRTCYMNFCDAHFKLWRITHYVSLPTEASLTLTQKGVQGMTTRQQRWLSEEKSILADKGMEFTATLLSEFPYTEYRAVLTAQQLQDFRLIEATLNSLEPKKVKKCKSPLVSITTRFYNSTADVRTEEGTYLAEDAEVLVDWLKSISDSHRAADNLENSRLLAVKAANAAREQFAQRFNTPEEETAAVPAFVPELALAAA